MNAPMNQRDHLQLEIAKAVDGLNRLCKADDPFKQFHKDDLGLCVVRDGSGDYWLYIEANDYPGRNFFDEMADGTHGFS